MTALLELGALRAHLVASHNSNSRYNVHRFSGLHIVNVTLFDLLTVYVWCPSSYTLHYRK
jgi:hypothetical protein